MKITEARLSIITLKRMRDKAEGIDIYILCGGRGKRLRKISRGIPKPMMKIGDRPFLDIIIDFMSGFGFKRFILGTGYRSKLIRDYYSNKDSHGLEIGFCEEKTPLDTGGALKKTVRLIKSDPFFVLNGDTFCRFNPLRFLRFHRDKKSIASIILRKVSRAPDYGEIRMNGSGRIISFREKNEKAEKCLVNSGVYLFDKKIFGLMPASRKFSLEKDLFPSLSGKDFFGYITPGFFIDIGTPERYSKARNYFLKQAEHG